MKPLEMLLYSSLLSLLSYFNVALGDNRFDKHALSTNINNELNKLQECLNIDKLSLNVNKKEVHDIS